MLRAGLVSRVYLPSIPLPLLGLHKRARYTFLSCHDVRRVKKEWSHDINGRADASAARLSSIL